MTTENETDAGPAGSAGHQAGSGSGTAQHDTASDAGAPPAWLSAAIAQAMAAAGDAAPRPPSGGNDATENGGAGPSS